MPLLNATHKKSKKITLHILIEENVFSEIKAYCDWSRLDKPAEFVMQAIHYVLNNDKDWRKAKNSDVKCE